ncbi:hypothetical protein COB55_00610 [Candidatus Wolfebacteria bacterium]|nr:MAG: hypothetical protein COB55_00610 [Candidatus Wolfebacteria bacterium]
MAYNKTTRNKVLSMRKEGYSYTDISKVTGVARGTLSDWLCDMEYTPNKEVVKRIGKARVMAAEAQRQKKLSSLQEAERRARVDIGNLSERDLFLLGIGVYIGEGAKSQDSIRVINANPEVINLAIRWLKNSCGLSTKNLKLAIHIYPDNNMQTCLQFWAQSTGIPKSQFGKTQIDKRKKKNIKRGKLPFGTAHLLVKSCGNPDFGVTLSRRIHGWMKTVYSQVNR